MVLEHNSLLSKKDCGMGDVWNGNVLVTTCGAYIFSYCSLAEEHVKQNLHSHSFSFMQVLATMYVYYHECYC